MATSVAKKTERMDVGTGDVFKDRGFVDADERKLRTQLALLACCIAPRRIVQPRVHS
jgi:hypothetical protein